jgi:hypothetical protein
MQDSWIRCLVNKNYASQLHKQREIKKEHTRKKKKQSLLFYKRGTSTPNNDKSTNAF